MVTKNAQFTNYLHMALAMVIEMGLNKPVTLKMSRFISTAKTALGKDLLPSLAPHTLEERRAFLGCFYLMSM